MFEVVNTLACKDAAILYAQYGWPVFPLQEKIPFKDSHGFYDATTDYTTIHAWWTEDTSANIGLATGSMSGIIVLDVDPRHQGHESVKALEKRYGPLPSTRVSRTAHGGMHHFYQYPFDGNTYPNAIELDQLCGVDVRADGGYVVLPPSKLFNRLSYCWTPKALSLAPAPDWLLALLHRPKEPQRIFPQGNYNATAPAEKWLFEALSQAHEGNRNQMGFFLACQLRDDGVPEVEARKIILTYAASVPRGKSAYTTREALASVASAYKRPARPPARRQTR